MNRLLVALCTALTLVSATAGPWVVEEDCKAEELIGDLQPIIDLHPTLVIIKFTNRPSAHQQCKAAAVTRLQGAGIPVIIEEEKQNG